MRDVTDNEVGGFGVTKSNDLLFVTDFVLVKQKVTSISVSFDDESISNFFEDQVEAGRQPEQFARIWIHTHPCDSLHPSDTDESTFRRVFGSCDWSLMLIVAQEGGTYARLRFNSGPGGEVEIPVVIDYSHEFDASNFGDWKQHYLANVAEEKMNDFESNSNTSQNVSLQEGFFGSDTFESLDAATSEELLLEIDDMDPMEREYFMNELSLRSDFWDETESEVFYD